MNERLELWEGSMSPKRAFSLKYLVQVASKADIIKHITKGLCCRKYDCRRLPKEIITCANETITKKELFFLVK